MLLLSACHRLGAAQKVQLAVALLMCAVLVAGCRWRPDAVYDDQVPFDRLDRPGDNSDAGLGKTAPSANPREVAEPANGAFPRQSAAQLLAVTTEVTDAAGQPVLDEKGLVRRQMISGWYRAADNDRSAYRWRHRGIDRYNDLAPELRPDLRAALRNENRLISATAAIALARSEGAAFNSQLVEIVHPFTVDIDGAPQVRTHELTARRAAIETLAKTDHPSAVPLLAELYSIYRLRSQSQQDYSPQLHEELLRGIARYESACTDPRFIESLASAADELKVTILELMAADSRGTLPDEAVALASGANPALRVAALKAIGAQRHAAAFEVVLASAYDGDLSIRLAAIEALGRLADPRSRAELHKLWQTSKERIQQAALVALAGMGDRQVVYESARHSSWRLRRTAAELLSADWSGQALALAPELIEDASGDVQLRLIDSLDSWPLDVAGPLLLQGARSSYPLTRDAAFRMLASRWPPAAPLADTFLSQAQQAAISTGNNGRTTTLQDRRNEILAQLEQRWHDDFPHAATTRDDVAASFSAAENAQHAGNESELLRLIGQMQSSSLVSRRGIATQVVQMAAVRPLSPAALEILAESMRHESDPAVWRSIMPVFQQAEGAAAETFAYAALAQSLVDVRIEACRMLERQPAPRHAAELFRLLESDERIVVQAALAALAKCGPIEDFDPLLRLLASQDRSLRVEAAAALAQLGSPYGPAALERLTFDPDVGIRLQAVAAMGRSRDPLFLSALIAQLDDANETSIRRAALAALPQIIGNDITELQSAGGIPHTGDAAQLNYQQKAELWRRWYLSGGRS